MRFGIIGVGANVFAMHARAIKSHAAALELVGVADINLAAAEQRAEEFGCPCFADYHELLTQTHPEAVAVITPHPLHAPIAIDCMQSGAHVLVEKPIAVEVAEADRMIEAARDTGRLLAVNLQHRTRAEIRAAKKLISDKRLGEIQRVQMTAIWTRTRRYYDLAGWRGTWRGEGGGVLMNQSPHTLDVICHLAGQPERVAAWNRTVFHAIETEDTSVAMLEWPNHAIGTLVVSTAQAGDAERLEIAGTRGVLQITNGKLSFRESATDLRDFLTESEDPFGKLALESRDVPLDSGGGDHTAVYANFIDAVEHGAPLVADGSEARMSLELANALIYSSATNRQVTLPLDRDAYAELLMDMVRGALAGPRQ
jgi:predicted dehydrogenase